MTVTRLGRVTGEGGGLLRVAVVPFLATRLPLLLAGVLSVALIPVSRHVESYWLVKGLDRAFDAFSRWDAWHYTRIALSGYPETDPARAAFFPLFPTLIRVLAEVVGRTDRPGLFAAAVVVANMCLVLATMVLIALVRLDLDADDARRAAWYLLAFPTSLFLSAGYSESLFLLLIMGAILACRTDHWLTAGILGGAAALSRPVGVWVVLPLAIEAFLAWRAGRLRPWRPMWRPAVAIVLPGVFLLGWMWFQWLRFGDPLAFLHAQDGWNREVGPPWDTLMQFFAVPLPDRPRVHAHRHRRGDPLVALAPALLHGVVRGDAPGPPDDRLAGVHAPLRARDVPALPGARHPGPAPGGP
jgi:Gpi18-like mannosyltransferase